MSFKKILVAIDSSKTSWIALYEAIPLAKNLHAKLCIVTVAEEVPTPGYLYAADLTKYQDKVICNDRNLLEEMQRQVLKEDILAEIILVENPSTPNNISEKIIEVVNTWGADLLVVGTHSRRGVRRFLLGSIAEETLRHSPIPVLLIPSNETD